MLPYLYKKYGETKALIDYYEDRISGEVIKVYNDAVLKGIRLGELVVDVDLPFRHSEGVSRARRYARYYGRTITFKTPEIIELVKSIYARTKSMAATVREMTELGIPITRTSVWRVVRKYSVEELSESGYLSSSTNRVSRHRNGLKKDGV